MKEIMLIEVVQTTITKYAKRFVVQAKDWPEAKAKIEKEIKDNEFLMENEATTYFKPEIKLEALEYDPLIKIDQLDEDEHLIGFTLEQLTQKLNNNESK